MNNRNQSILRSSVDASLHLCAERSTHPLRFPAQGLLVFYNGLRYVLFEAKPQKHSKLAISVSNQMSN